MSRYRILDQKGLTYVTCTVAGWVDVFSRRAYRDILLESLAYCRKEKGLKVFAFVVMSNHIHLLVQSPPGSRYTLSAILRDFKKYTARFILEAIQDGSESRQEWLLYLFSYFARKNTNNRHFQFWKQDNHPVWTEHPQVVWQKIDYIHLNPVKAGIVEHPEDYLYSSARNYAKGNERGLLEIDLLEPFLPGGGAVFLPGR